MARSQDNKEIIRSFERSVTTIKAIIWDARYQPYQELTHEQKGYIQELKKNVYEAEDLLDELVTSKVRFPLSPTKIREINQFRDKLESIGRSDRPFGLEAGDHVSSPIRRVETCSDVCEEENIIGREADKESLVAMLLSDFHYEDSDPSVSFVSIVGTGGLGKTTLARLVYHDPRIQTAFDLRFWAYVGEDFTIQDVLSKILGKSSELELNKLLEQVGDKLQGKKFFFVLDDVWCEEPDQWDQLKDLLTVIGATQSRMLVTTRSLRVAQLIGYSRIHELEGLSEDDSCNLFHKIAFPSIKEPNAELIRFGKEITQKCANLPLAIRSAASSMRGQDRTFWPFFESLDFIDAGKVMDSVMAILWPSYQHLPRELKMCFEFCSIFPKDYVIQKDVLIAMWSALGYLVPSHQDQSLEEIGEGYCLMLLSRCLFQETERDEYGKIMSFKMNNWIRILAEEEAGEEILTLTDTNTCKLMRIRHLSISKFASTFDWLRQHHPASETLRTMLNAVKYVQWSYEHVNAMLSQCRLLRVLDLHGVPMEALPDTFDKVPHLRYLDLSENEELEKLPNSITKLHCLETLRLRGCKRLEELPQYMSRLVKLRTLDIDGCTKLIRFPAWMEDLVCLRMFTMSVVGGDSSKLGNRGKVIHMKALVNLKDCILIKVDKFSLNNMPKKGTYVLKDAHLQALKIICADGSSSDQGDDYQTLLEIQGYLGTNLTTVKLSHSGGLQHLTTLSQLKHLKYLHLQKLRNVESIESNAPIELKSGPKKSMIFFPSLEKLVLEEMETLKGWWRDLLWMAMEDGGGYLVNSNGRCIERFVLPTFPHLCDLSIRLCPRMTYFPPCPHVKQLELNGVDESFCLIGSSLSNPMASVSCNTRIPSLCLEKLIVYYNARVFDSLFGKSVVSSAVDIDISFFFREQSLQVAREGFRRCSSSLRSLSIHGFYELKSLSGGGIEHLTNLQSLSIKECLVLDLTEFGEEGEEKGMPWNSLQSLTSLKLDDIPKLVKLPKGFQHLTALQSLQIKSCINLEALGESVHLLKPSSFSVLNSATT